MIVSSAPYVTGGQSSRARFSRANAFRVLSLPADAELKKIFRQRDRILVAIELGELQGIREFNLFPLSDLAKEEVLEAVHRLELPDDRLIEELFWVHEMESRGDLVEGRIVALRGAADGNTIRGAVARHNLAVIQGILAQELAGNRRFDRWEEALKIWRKLIDEDIFWTFMEDRAGRIDCRSADAGMMRAAVCRQLSLALSGELTRAVKSRELTAVAALARIAVEHRPWLKVGAALDSVGEHAIRDGFVSLGAILDRLARITSQDNANIQSSLLEREKELRGVAAEYGAVVRSLGELADADGWDDALASAFQKLSVAYFNLLDDPRQAIRLIGQAREFARDPKLRQSMQRDWQHVQRAVFCQDADALMQRGDFAGAEEKLAAALAISTEEQTNEIKGMQDRYRRAHVLSGVDSSRKNPVLYTLNGVGSMFYGRRDYDPGTRSYVTNHWLTFLFFPVFPLGAYRVTDADSRSYYIHGKVALSNFLKIARWAIAASVAVLILMAFITGGASPDPPGTPPPGPFNPTEPPITKETPPAISTSSQDSAKEHIEQERTALIALLQSLEDRRRELQGEDAEMRKQKRYLESVASSYAGEDVPRGGQSTYEAVLADYNSRVQKYDRMLAALKADFAAYNERVNLLNARIKILNGFR
jgi:tetratricopeptide (TPR) repeat protein